jgi:hypothetical protein
MGIGRAGPRGMELPSELGSWARKELCISKPQLVRTWEALLYINVKRQVGSQPAYLTYNTLPCTWSQRQTNRERRELGTGDVRVMGSCRPNSRECGGLISTGDVSVMGSWM